MISIQHPSELHDTDQADHSDFANQCLCLHSSAVSIRSLCNTRQLSAENQTPFRSNGHRNSDQIQRDKPS